MLALGAANLVGVVLFAGVYAAGGARYLSQGGFAVCLLLLFALVTALWVRTESRHAPLGFVRRLGRAVAGLAMVVVGVPVVALMPFFWLESALPPDAGFSRIVAPIMTLILIALALVALMNLVGALVQGARGFGRRPVRRPG